MGKINRFTNYLINGNSMSSFNYQDMPMSVWADTLEDQGIDTTDLRAWIETGCYCPGGYGYSYGSGYVYGYEYRHGDGYVYGDGYSYGYVYVNGKGAGDGSGYGDGSEQGYWQNE